MNTLDLGFMAQNFLEYSEILVGVSFKEPITLSVEEPSSTTFKIGEFEVYALNFDRDSDLLELHMRKSIPLLHKKLELNFEIDSFVIDILIKYCCKQNMIIQIDNITPSTNYIGDMYIAVNTFNFN